MKDFKLKVSSWEVREKDGEKTVAGVYVVTLGGKEIAKQAFNGDYGSCKIVIPPEILVKINAMDAEIKQAIINNYQGE